jgi:hypothetical protein
MSGGPAQMAMSPMRAAGILPISTGTTYVGHQDGKQGADVHIGQTRRGLSPDQHGWKAGNDHSAVGRGIAHTGRGFAHNMLSFLSLS